jgi:hypothetical protein
VTELDNNVKINFIIDVPMNDTFKEKYEDYLEKSDSNDRGYKTYLVERYMKNAVEDLLDEVRKDYKTFDGKFVLEIRHERIKGIFQSPIEVRESAEEPLRRNFFDRFKEITSSDDLRVDVNLNCMT